MKNNYDIDLSIMPKEFRLIVEIMKMENDKSTVSFNSKLLTDIDWELFLQLTRHHRVYPLIYSKLKKLDEKWIPSHVIQTLYQEFKENTLQMLLLSGEMEQVSKIFIEHQIRILFLKGPVIAADLYGDISLRTSKDLDILISINDLEKADKLLINLGYNKVVVPTAMTHWKWREHHISYIHPKKLINIEVHWRLHPAPSNEPIFNDLWERKRTSTLTTYPVFFFSEEDLYLYLVAHGSRHGWFRLRWLIDIDKIVKKSIHLKRSDNPLKIYQYQHLGKQAHHLESHALILASTLLNTPIGEEMETITVGQRSRSLIRMSLFYINEMAHLQTTNPENDLAKYNKRYLLSLVSNIKKTFIVNRYQFLLKANNLQKLMFIITLFFFPSSFDVESFKLPKHLQFLYFPLRPFIWAWRKTKKPI
ncbi:hypothetical protein ASG99_07660 [Bacillus sp. Soil768D1]|nr:hypothetical protein ASG99_07660 [Bacillus sp. Soil768D1]